MIITGDSGNGLTHGTIGGMIACDLLRGRSNPWAELYRPDRLAMRAMGEFAGHNAQVLGHYSDWFTTGDVPSVDDVRPGCGAVVRDGLGKLAVYRNAAGALHVCSAVCPHLGGLVRWNASEKTWDCPCHGSRFDAYGKVLNGPANADLTPQVPSGGGLAQTLSTFAL
jgi:nitrite reductase/ring-hydroxylating ferredoxin subunit